MTAALNAPMDTPPQYQDKSFAPRESDAPGPPKISQHEKTSYVTLTLLRDNGPNRKRSPSRPLPRTTLGQTSVAAFESRQQSRCTGS